MFNYKSWSGSVDSATVHGVIYEPNQGINRIQIQYKTYNAPYITKMLFVGAGMTRD